MQRIALLSVAAIFPAGCWK